MGVGDLHGQRNDSNDSMSMSMMTYLTTWRVPSHPARSNLKTFTKYKVLRELLTSILWRSEMYRRNVLQTII